MPPVIDFFKVLLADVSINLSSGDADMAQHFLDRAKVSPIFQKMSGKAMPQGVR